MTVLCMKWTNEDSQLQMPLPAMMLLQSPSLITACGKISRKQQKPFFNSPFNQCLDTLPLNYCPMQQ